mgnify:CR=1 FL=1
MSLFSIPSFSLQEEGIYRFELACGVKGPAICEMNVSVQSHRLARVHPFWRVLTGARRRSQTFRSAGTSMHRRRGHETPGPLLPVVVRQIMMVARVSELSPGEEIGWGAAVVTPTGEWAEPDDP